jgi:hypothetical protein
MDTDGKWPARILAQNLLHLCASRSKDRRRSVAPQGDGQPHRRRQRQHVALETKMCFERVHDIPVYKKEGIGIRT